MNEDSKKVLLAVGVGVGATAAIATAMYFLGGREAPKMPSFGDLTGFAKRETGFGALNFNSSPEERAAFWKMHERLRTVDSDDPASERWVFEWTNGDDGSIQALDKADAIRRVVGVSVPWGFEPVLNSFIRREGRRETAWERDHPWVWHWTSGGYNIASGKLTRDQALAYAQAFGLGVDEASLHSGTREEVAALDALYRH